jgi:SAM-dependent methyltransferase
VTARTRWITDNPPGHSRRYVERFRATAQQGADLAGEARLVDALVPPRSRILDAGCGTGRVGAVLTARGHEVVGVDADPELIEAARADHPVARWEVADLATLDLGSEAPFDAAVLAGNVLLFVAPSTEQRILERVATHVRPAGLVVTGFSLGRGYAIGDLDTHAAAAGLELMNRFATWDLRPYFTGADYAVSVFFRPAEAE